VKLKFTGKGYGYTDDIKEVIADTNQYLSIEHDEEASMVTVNYGEGSWMTFEREGFTCEVLTEVESE